MNHTVEGIHEDVLILHIRSLQACAITKVSETVKCIYANANVVHVFHARKRKGCPTLPTPCVAVELETPAHSGKVPLKRQCIVPLTVSQFSSGETGAALSACHAHI